MTVKEQVFEKEVEKGEGIKIVLGFYLKTILIVGGILIGILLSYECLEYCFEYELGLIISVMFRISAIAVLVARARH